MAEFTIQLPTSAQHPVRTIDHCEWRVRTFVERDAYIAYDWLGGLQSPADIIDRRHLRATNSAMRARTPVDAWARYFGQKLPQLESIPADLDLISGPQDSVERGLEALAQLVRRLSSERGVTDMAASKILHLLRPKFVAISDGYVRSCLGIHGGIPAPPAKSDACAERMLQVQRAMRTLGEETHEALEHLHAHANALPHLPAGAGVQPIPVRLSRVRILDILLWTEVALHRATPHQNWRKWFTEAWGAVEPRGR